MKRSGGRVSSPADPAQSQARAKMGRRWSRYTHLVLYKAYADLAAESQRTYVGFVWWVAEPMLSMLVYYTVFALILNRGGEDYIAFLIAGILPWRWFQNTLIQGSNSIRAAKGLMQQVHVPKIAFPVILLLTNSVKFLVVLILLSVLFLIWGFPVGLHSAGLLLLIAVQLLWTASVTILAAAIIPFLPDLRIVLQNVTRLWFFLSGVFFDIGRLPEKAQFYLRLNPMGLLLESYRQVMLKGQWPDIWSLLMVAGLSAALLALAAWCIHRFEYAYPKLPL